MERSERSDGTRLPWHLGVFVLLAAGVSSLPAQSAERTPQQMSAGAPQVAAGQPLQTVRHTLIATVGTVTQVALSSPRRLPADRFVASANGAASEGAAPVDMIPTGAPAADGVTTHWSQMVSVRGNIAMRLELQSVGTEASGRWSVLRADTRAAVPILRGSAPQLLPGVFEPGRHEVELLWEGVGPDDTPPQLRARVIPAGAAR